MLCFHNFVIEIFGAQSGTRVWNLSWAFFQICNASEVLCARLAFRFSKSLLDTATEKSLETRKKLKEATSLMIQLEKAYLLQKCQFKCKVFM